MLTAGRAGQRLPVALALWSSAVFALQIGVARLGYGLALPAIRETLHGNYTLYGTINAISLGGYMAGALIAPLLIGRVRARVLVSSIVGAAALVISAFAADTLVFSLARTVFGFTSGVSLVCAAVETLEAVDASRRGGVSAVMWGGIGIGLLLSAIAARSRPCTSMVPLLGRSSPPSKLSKVDFPDPDLPSSATRSPRWTSNDTPRKAYTRAGFLP